MTRPERYGALCCECGTARTVSSKYYGMQTDQSWENFTPASIQRMREGGHARYTTDWQPFWRQLITLKCTTCGGRTRHARFRLQADDACYAERSDHGLDYVYDEPPGSSMGAAFEALGAIGIRVREVSNLSERSLLMPTSRLLVIDESLTDAERLSIARQVLARFRLK